MKCKWSKCMTSRRGMTCIAWQKHSTKKCFVYVYTLFLWPREGNPASRSISRLRPLLDRVKWSVLLSVCNKGLLYKWARLFPSRPHFSSFVRINNQAQVFLEHGAKKRKPAGRNWNCFFGVTLGWGLLWPCDMINKTQGRSPKIFFFIVRLKRFQSWSFGPDDRRRCGWEVWERVTALEIEGIITKKCWERRIQVPGNKDGNALLYKKSNHWLFSNKMRNRMFSTFVHFHTLPVRDMF